MGKTGVGLTHGARDGQVKLQSSVMGFRQPGKAAQRPFSLTHRLDWKKGMVDLLSRRL